MVGRQPYIFVDVDCTESGRHEIGLSRGYIANSSGDAEHIC